MTFSLIGYCKNTGMLGVAITTSSICVGSRCPWVRAGVGAVATQNITLPSIGNMVLNKIEKGLNANAALDKSLSELTDIEYRQVTVIDHNGNTAEFSGEKMLGKHAVAIGENCVAAGNLLNSHTLPNLMTTSFENNCLEHLAERLLKSLEVGLYEAGGEVGNVHSAALLIADKHSWPIVDLRCDWDDNDPLKILRTLWTNYKPQMGDYIIRALNPKTAPSYGVPGDE